MLAALSMIKLKKKHNKFLNRNKEITQLFNCAGSKLWPWRSVRPAPGPPRAVQRAPGHGRAN